MPVGRFVTMALLQAARARALGLTEESAYSWGLNRAIFYAAAKRGFKGGVGAPSRAEAGNIAEVRNEPGKYYLGDELTYLDKESSFSYRPFFSIGRKTQTPTDFETQVASRFGSKSNLKKAWHEALKIVGGYDKRTLESQHGFYDRVYKPRRDNIVKEWTGRFAKKTAPISTRE